MRLVLLEYNAEQANWADLLPLIQTNLDQTPVFLYGQAVRLKLYADKRFHVNEKILEHIVNRDEYLTVEQFVQLRAHATQVFKVLVYRDDLMHIEDSCEPVTTMTDEHPVRASPPV
ncbi:hypothetical protein PHMEG_00012709 [Phytophthora megakarya]|uniref:Uncharacterized protein n=1 Tax=Phytophthora megakarya TaxID=4795 RepID=A0A225W8K0_9STRA|nr:hypothetical protein PHMEG_00012709 [Phytophthora megakarya]